MNAVVAIKRAGSGHLGSSFSALDIVVHLLYEPLNVAEFGFEPTIRRIEAGFTGLGASAKSRSSPRCRA